MELKGEKISKRRKTIRIEIKLEKYHLIDGTHITSAITKLFFFLKFFLEMARFQNKFIASKEEKTKILYRVIEWLCI